MLAYAIRQFDGNAFRQQVLSEFSGVLCIAEIHLGKRVLLLASAPIAEGAVGEIWICIDVLIAPPQ